ncbi:MAG: hypothetical protein ACLRW7_21235 [Phocaeicola vulgatus]
MIWQISYENYAGKLTKIKAIYMICSMMSDYGTYRNETTRENITMEEALSSFRLVDSTLKMAVCHSFSCLMLCLKRRAFHAERLIVQVFARLFEKNWKRDFCGK